ncbi:hypothetical protein TNCV_3834621 [Trichonephila clavipes]|nr:hypothetical protein TNCV_3834621 [Trichonephila clavipes]
MCKSKIKRRKYQRPYSVRVNRSWLAFGRPYGPIECLLIKCHRPIAAGPFSSHQDIPAETMEKTIIVPVTTPPCHVRTTNQDTLYQAGPLTSGHIYNLDMGWRNASRSISQ